MFQFVNYSAFSGPDALNQPTSMVDAINTIQASNAIFDHINITRDTTLPWSTEKPEEWDYDTIFNAKFNGNVEAGNIDAAFDEINAIRIKRRIKGTFDWLTLETIPINEPADLTFAFVDRLNAWGTEYEYAFVPVINQQESTYIINEILSEFNGVFIGDFNSTYRLVYGVDFGTSSLNQQVGVFTPLGKKYPVIVANGELNYDSGTVTATILNNDFADTREVKVKEIVEQKKILSDFLMNKKPKLLRTWTGEVWLCMITDSPQYTYAQGSGLKIPKLTFSWTEIGDATSQQDLYDAGILDEVV